MFKLNPLLCTDSYKLSHKGFMVHGTQQVYSNLTPRSFKYMPIPASIFQNKLVFFGLQGVLKQMQAMWYDGFFSLPKAKAIRDTKRVLDAYLGADAISMQHFELLHDFGALPIEIKALPEGTLVPAGIPLFTITNTDPRFAWLTNYLETYLSAELWKSSTVATIAYHYRLLSNKYALETTGSTVGTEFQNHDFSYRGMSNTLDAATCGAAFLLSSSGTDNVPALQYLEDMYGVDLSKEFVATSVPASEHSLASAGIAFEGELETYRRWITKDYPSGIVSVVADTLDFFRVVTEYATELKEDILNRTPNALGLAKVVFRPDSGDPVKIICGDPDAPAGTPEHKGAIECLFDIFGGTTTDQGYRVLHERVGLIYGDSITLDRAEQIYQRLKDKRFASTNVVLGIGSYTCQYLTRDSAGMAVKATAAVIGDSLYPLTKNPKTDDGTKKSASGFLAVTRSADGELLLSQNVAKNEPSLLRTVYLNGAYAEMSFDHIKRNLWRHDVKGVENVGPTSDPSK